jgi:hypothetical protein
MVRERRGVVRAADPGSLGMEEVDQIESPLCLLISNVHAPPLKQTCQSTEKGGKSRTGICSGNIVKALHSKCTRRKFLEGSQAATATWEPLNSPDFAQVSLSQPIPSTTIPSATPL